MKPLEGIKVVELGTHVAVPSAARLLADWGADVIKVENPTGDLWRYYGENVYAPTTKDENPIFAVPNANKKIIALDLKTQEGIDILFKLLEGADAFLSNVRLNSLKKLGLDYDSVSEKFPGLVYMHFTGFGYEGPLADNPGFDIAAYWSAGGMLSDWPMAGDMPFAPSAAFGDSTVSTSVASGVLTGLLYKMRTGKGIRLTTSLYANALWYNFGDLIGCQPQYGYKRQIVDGQNENAFLRAYECSDGDWVYLAALEYDRAYVKCMKVLGLEQYLDDARFNTLAAYRSHRREFCDILDEAFRKKPSDEWIKLFVAADVVIQKLMRATSLPKSEQAWANHYIREVDYPISGNKTVFPNTPIKFFGAEESCTKHVGGIGCDSRTVLREHGYSDGEIEELLARKIVTATE